METLTFITGNSIKIEEARRVFPDIHHHEIDLPEIQSLNLREIVEAKLDAASAKGERSIMVEDTMLALPCLNGLPGTLIKWFVERIGSRGIAELAAKYPDQTAIATSLAGVICANGDRLFSEGSVRGRIVFPRGVERGWNSIFLPDGHDKTFGEITADERASLSMRTIAFQKLKIELRARG